MAPGRGQKHIRSVAGDERDQQNDQEYPGWTHGVESTLKVTSRFKEYLSGWFFLNSIFHKGAQS